MTEPTPPLAGRREWIGLAVIALPCLLYSMDLTVLNLAVPAISADLRPSAAQLLWIVDIYGFMIAGCLITMGTLGDRIGRRRLLMIGAAAFGLASAVAAFSTSANMLILARAALGVASATLAPSTLSLIRNMFLDPRERTFAIGIWIASFSAGARDMLGAALTIAESLGSSGAAVAQAARAAFVDAVSIALLVSAAIALLAGLVAAIWLRGSGGASQDINETDPERAPACAG